MMDQVRLSLKGPGMSQSLPVLKSTSGWVPTIEEKFLRLYRRTPAYTVLILVEEVSESAHTFLTLPWNT